MNYLTFISFSISFFSRGISSINWAVINQDSRTGYSIFYVDKYIDHGPIVLQESIAIGPDDTVKSLYFSKLFPMGVEGICKAVTLIAEGKMNKSIAIAQNHLEATYEPPCKGELSKIQWHARADQVYALIRGCDPQPGAYTMYEGKELRIFDCSFSRELAVGWPGKVLQIGEGGGFSVRLNGGTLLVKRVQEKGGAKEPAVDWAKRVGLTVGHRF